MGMMEGPSIEGKWYNKRTGKTITVKDMMMSDEGMQIFTTDNQLPFGTFTTKTCMNATLYVPEESVSLYQNAEGWNCFWNIKSIESAGVDEIRIDNNLPILYFDINGRQINHPSNGVFIEKQGKKLRKILIP